MTNCLGMIKYVENKYVENKLMSTIVLIKRTKKIIPSSHYFKTYHFFLIYIPLNIWDIMLGRNMPF